MKKIQRKSLLYKTAVEYGDYTINHVLGCSHGCMYPCYAMMMAKRFGKVKTYKEWVEPKIVGNAVELLKKEIPKHKDKIKYVHFCFSTDPFMYEYPEVTELTIKLISMLNDSGIKCTALTKGLLPISLAELSDRNEFGITLVSLDEKFRNEYEPFSAPYSERIKALYKLHKKGVKTWVSMEPYPTPNFVEQDFGKVLEAVSFADKIIFGRLNYNAKVSLYPEHILYFNRLAAQVNEFAKAHGQDCYIKDGTITETRGMSAKTTPACKSDTKTYVFA